MPQQLERFEDEAIISLQDAAKLLGMEQTKLEHFAQSMAYGLKSKLLRGRRYFYASDLRNYHKSRTEHVSTLK
jgi:hypothetical protein